jgi:hypothetical protein
MSTAVIKKQIIKKVEYASDEDLQRILDYMNSLAEREVRKKEFLSYAGSWADMPQDFIDDLTKNLHKRRKSRRSIVK